ncbi:hypothetical protein BC831DRAFT_484940 [Entophlyctis helioformis]|nr:hypothetical protein BC831DRAFT_484940 [Entophlyctis helioformis]
MADDSEHRRGSIAAIQLEDLLIRPPSPRNSLHLHELPPYSSDDPLALLPDVISNKPWGSDSVSYMSEQLPVEDMVHVLQHVGRNRTVRKLYLSGNNVALTDEVMPILCRSLQTNTTLSYLNLASCSISTRGAAALGIALRSNRTLSVLLVQDNSFLEDGAIAFARTLAGPNRNAKNTVLRTLNLSGNAIMDTGFAALSHGIIRSLVGLVELHLVSNCITDESAMHIAHLVASHPALEELYLQENRLGNATVLAVDKALTKPPMAGNMSPSRSGSTRRQLSTGIPLASFASLPSGLDQARSPAPSTSFAALHPTPSPTLLSPIQSAFSSSSLSTSPLPPASPSSPSVSPSWLSILSSPFSASPSSANSQRSASPPTGQLVQPLHFSNIRVVNFLANTRITLRSRAVVNRSRLWWKHKHEVRYRMDRPVRLSMHTTL